MLAWIKRKLQLRTRWRRFRALVDALGLRAALKYLQAQRLTAGRDSAWTIHPRQALHPLCGRAGTSDIDVFRQIFVEREYGCLDDLPGVRLVLDCGANVGYSAAYFLSRFPQCQVIAVEPDTGNFEMLRRNLAGYGARVRLVHAGVWSQAVRLELSRATYRDGRDWARQVQPAPAGAAGAFDGVTIDSLLGVSGCPRISLLKVDVEGAEAVLFAEHFQSWLDKVDAIAIELHDDSAFGKATDVFFAAIAGQGFQVTRSGELTICRRLAVLPA